MKKLYLNTGRMNTIFNDLKDSLNGTLTLENNQYNLTVKSKNAKGVIRGIMLSQQISYMEFDIVFHKDTMLSMESGINSPIWFTYCFEGNLRHSFGINGKIKKVKSDQTGIVRNTSAINSIFYFEGFKHIRFSILSCNTSNIENTDLFSGLDKVFRNQNGNYITVATQNFLIAKKIKEFKAVPQKGMVKNLLRKRILESILEIELEQYSYGYLKDIKPIIALANKQIEELKRVSNLSISAMFSGVNLVSRNYLSRMLKEKYHLTFSKSYNQKLVS
ncbi:hypothetical protein [Flavobacterium pectinovorum]|uniref:hypothetical protein n=1 Tax=Flavobacterium pectinovorum TaxID=29533 RepID=UPI001FAC7798|nr:hypothetical protein [Flavobacterium pectinovorum]MCI9844837.1 hypothetical protein [Flavobacterium pectinovorum]